jgi:nitrite reductase/ring-hydroxylating ferredoxin subunit
VTVGSSAITLCDVTRDPSPDQIDDPTSGTAAGCGSCLGRRTLFTAAAVAVGGLGLGTGPGGGTAAATSSSWVTVCRTSAVPVGDGYFFSLYGQPWVVTQPAAGTFKGFSARCTHQGGTCNDVVRRAIQCPVHGSRYSLRTGAVVRGPATAALPAVRVRVDRRRVQMRF